jgi:hypothetical protein
LSRELEIEQLQSDIASLGRIQDVMQEEIYRAQDELCCMTQKSKQFEVEVTLHISDHALIGPYFEGQSI